MTANPRAKKLGLTQRHPAKWPWAPMIEDSAGEHQQVGLFRTTHWSVVLTASNSNAPGAQAALAKLCQTYRYPLYAYIRRRGHGPEEAEDLTQGFFERLLEKDSLAGITREGGRFRSFLLTVLNRYLVNEWARHQTRKRGGGHVLMSLDQADPEARYKAEPVDSLSPDLLFERRWAITLLDKVMKRIETEYRQRKKAEIFDRLKVFLSGAPSQGAYAEIARQLNMSEDAVKVAVYRLRRRYGEIVREEITRTVASPEEVEEEIRYLISVLSR